MEDTVLIKETDAAGKVYWRMTRLAAYNRYVRTIKPLDDLIHDLWKELKK